MKDTVTAYLIQEGGKDYLCTLERDGFFQKLEISIPGIARLATECSTRLWDEVRGKNGAAPNP